MAEQNKPESIVSGVAFDNIRKVVELSRRLALEDYFRNVEAISRTTNQEEKDEAVARLLASHKTAKDMDEAYKSLLSAESDFRSTTVSLLQGEQAKAEKQALDSSGHLNDVAKNLKSFSDVAPKSKFFASSLNALANADRIIGKIEDDVIMTVEHFSTGLKHFAEQVSSFATAVAKFPSVMAEKVKETGVSMSVAIKETGSRFMAGLRDSVSRVRSAMVDPVVDKAHQATQYIDSSVNNMATSLAAKEDSAWEVIERYSNEFQQLRQKAMDTISDHSAAVASFGKDAAKYFSNIAQNVAEDYRARLIDAQLERVDSGPAFPAVSARLINPMENQAKLDTFINNPDMSPRQILYTRLMSDFTCEPSQENRRLIMNTVDLLAKQTDQSEVEKDNARASWEHMAIFSKVKPDGKIIKERSSKILNVDQAMEILWGIQKQNELAARRQLLGGDLRYQQEASSEIKPTLAPDVITDVEPPTLKEIQAEDAHNRSAFIDVPEPPTLTEIQAEDAQKILAFIDVPEPPALSQVEKSTVQDLIARLKQSSGQDQEPDRDRQR